MINYREFPLVDGALLRNRTVDLLLAIYAGPYAVATSVIAGCRARAQSVGLVRLDGPASAAGALIDHERLSAE